MLSLCSPFSRPLRARCYSRVIVDFNCFGCAWESKKAPFYRCNCAICCLFNPILLFTIIIKIVHCLGFIVFDDQFSSLNRRSYNVMMKNYSTISKLDSTSCILFYGLHNLDGYFNLFVPIGCSRQFFTLLSFTTLILMVLWFFSLFILIAERSVFISIIWLAMRKSPVRKINYGSNR